LFRTSNSPCCAARKHAARLPLSAVDTYRGVSGVSVVVSYQLKKWPR
jgi:hypothetical protein